MTGIYIIAAGLIIAAILCFRSKSKFLQVLGVLIAVIAGLTLPPIYLKHSKEIGNEGYITITEISASIKDAQNEDAAQLRALIKSNYADRKISLSEFEEIGKAYSAYRAKYTVKH